MKQSDWFIQTRFKSAWLQYCRERGWSEADSFSKLCLMRSKNRGEATQMREEITRRMRDPANGDPVSFPNIAKMVGYKSHAACVAVMQRSAVA